MRRRRTTPEKEFLVVELLGVDLSQQIPANSYIKDIYIWVSFCRAGKMAISCHIFSKSRAFVKIKIFRFIHERSHKRRLHNAHVILSAEMQYLKGGK